MRWRDEGSSLKILLCLLRWIPNEPSRVKAKQESIHLKVIYGVNVDTKIRITHSVCIRPIDRITTGVCVLVPASWLDKTSSQPVRGHEPACTWCMVALIHQVSEPVVIIALPLLRHTRVVAGDRGGRPSRECSSGGGRRRRRATPTAARLPNQPTLNRSRGPRPVRLPWRRRCAAGDLPGRRGR